MLRLMGQVPLAGWLLSPGNSRFLPRGFVLRDWIDTALAHRVPFFVNTADGMSIEQVADLLQEYPSLRMVLTYADTRPNDRILRPLVESFPNLYLNLAPIFIDGFIESFVERYGPERLLFGTGYPDSYPGATLLRVCRAEIDEEARALIAGGNLRRLLGEVQL
jgi:predicted TIM-barrel fold metal-dependent hydrolase